MLPLKLLRVPQVCLPTCKLRLFLRRIFCLVQVFDYLGTSIDQLNHASHEVDDGDRIHLAKVGGRSCERDNLLQKHPCGSLGPKFRMARNPKAVWWYLSLHFGDLDSDLEDKRFTGTRGKAESSSGSLIPGGVFLDTKESSQEKASAMGIQRACE